MFALNKYTEKICELEWIFFDEKKEVLEDLLFVKFKKNDKGNYFIENILFSYFDILSGLEELDFIITKNKTELKIEIL